MLLQVQEGVALGSEWWARPRNPDTDSAKAGQQSVKKVLFADQVTQARVGNTSKKSTEAD